MFDRMKKLLTDRKIAGLLILLSVWVVYLNVWDNEFQFDDFHSIESNRSIRSLANIPSFFTDPGTFSDLPWMAMYRPVLVLSYAVNYYLTGPGEIGFNIGNILIHSVNALLIFSILVRFYPGFASLAGAMFFALAPICTQAVNYKSSRSVLLVAFFVLLSFRFYIAFIEKSNGKKKSLVPYFLSLLFYSLALLSKEIAITFPAILILYDYLIVRPQTPSGKTGPPFSMLALKRYLPFGIVSLIYLVIRKSFFSVATMSITKASLVGVVAGQPRNILTNVATQMISNFIYLWESLVPYGLSPVHEVPDASGFSDWRTITLIFLFAVLSLLFFRLRERDPLFIFGFFWFFVVLLPETIIPLNIKVNESRAYFPVVGFSLFIAASCNFFFSKYKKSAEVLFCFYLLVMAAVSVNRNIVWDNGWSLWSDTAKKAPNSERVYYSLGAISNTNKNYDEAIRYFERSIALNPYFHRPYNLLGVVLFKLGRLDEAIKNLKTAIKIAPHDGTTHFNLGIAYARQNDMEKARELFNKSLEMKPDFVPALLGIGRIFEMKGDLTGALGKYETALSIEPQMAEALERVESVKKRLRQ